MRRCAGRPQGRGLRLYQPAPPNVAVQEVKKPTPGVVTVVPKPLGCTWVFFNVTKPPFDNKKVRQAVAYAIDKKEIIKGTIGLAEEINNQFFTNDSSWYIPVKDREVDLARAKQLLAEAGYPNGFKMEFLQFTIPNPSMPAM